MKRQTPYRATVGVLALLAGSGFAQTAPDPGALLEQQRRAAQPALPAQEAHSAAEMFRGFGEVTGLEPPEVGLLREIEARYKGQEVSASRVLDIVSRELERKGVTAVLQTDAHGNVIAVKPVLAAVEIKDARARPRAPLGAVLTHGMSTPSPLDRRSLERNAALINELPGVSASYRMIAGEQPGETRLMASIEDGQAIDGFASVDNAGTRLTLLIAGQVHGHQINKSPPCASTVGLL